MTSLAHPLSPSSGTRPLAAPSHDSVVRARELALARVLTAYIGAGLVFMLVPGTFLGVWNLLQVSVRESVGFVSPVWLQAHGHAQVFGWIGSFILGIGFYSIPQLRAGARTAVGTAWTCWAMWTGGVALRWTTNVYGWHWRLFLPVSALLELAAFLVFLRMVSQHRAVDASGTAQRLETWVRVVMTGSVGLAATLVFNLVACVTLARHADAPAFAHGLDQRFLALVAWGFLAPFVWGFSLRWLPIFLGLRANRATPAAAAVVINVIAVLLAVFVTVGPATVLFVVSSALMAFAVGVFEPRVHVPKTAGGQGAFALFVRGAYVWLLIAAMLGVAAAKWDVSGGVWGASRHAFTVGFVATMVFAIGQRVLPHVAGLRPLWSPRLMFVSLLLLSIGCALRVSSEILAYQRYAAWAWSVLPVSALIEMAAVTCFAMNLTVTMALGRAPAGRVPLVTA